MCLFLCVCVYVCTYRDEHIQTIRSKILCRAEYALLSEHRQLPLPIVNVAKMCSVRPLLTLYRLASSSSSFSTSFPPPLHLFSISTPFLYLSPPLHPPSKYSRNPFSCYQLHSEIRITFCAFPLHLLSSPIYSLSPSTPLQWRVSTQRALSRGCDCEEGAGAHPRLW